jgi:hypothetical protein
MLLIPLSIDMRCCWVRRRHPYLCSVVDPSAPRLLTSSPPSLAPPTELAMTCFLTTDSTAPPLVSPSPSPWVAPPMPVGAWPSHFVAKRGYTIFPPAAAIPTAANRGRHGVLPHSHAFISGRHICCGLHRHQDLHRRGSGPIGRDAGYDREDGSNRGDEENSPT